MKKTITVMMKKTIMVMMMRMRMMMLMVVMMNIIFRGYNRSSQPQGIENYALEHLVEDVRGLVKVTTTSR